MGIYFSMHSVICRSNQSNFTKIDMKVGVISAYRLPWRLGRSLSVESHLL